MGMRGFRSLRRVESTPGDAVKRQRQKRKRFCLHKIQKGIHNFIPSRQLESFSTEWKSETKQQIVWSAKRESHFIRREKVFRKLLQQGKASSEKRGQYDANIL
jgi:hypothetical protein